MRTIQMNDGSSLRSNPFGHNERRRPSGTISLASSLRFARVERSEFWPTWRVRSVAHGHRVAIVTLMSSDEVPFYPLSSSIDLISIGGLGNATSLGRPANIAKSAWRVRRVLTARSPKLSWASRHSAACLRCSRAGDCRFPCRRRAHRSRAPRPTDRPIAQVRPRFPLSPAPITSSCKQLGRGAALSWMPQDRITCIANPVHQIARRLDLTCLIPTAGFASWAVGRLDRQKGFDLLLAAFIRLQDRFPMWDLVIHGEGPDRRSLEARPAMLPPGRIRLPGITADIEQELLDGHALAFPSRYEGFPNALAEGDGGGAADDRISRCQRRRGPDREHPARGRDRCIGRSVPADRKPGRGTRRIDGESEHSNARSASGRGSTWLHSRRKSTMSNGSVCFRVWR